MWLGRSVGVAGLKSLKHSLDWAWGYQVNITKSNLNQSCYIIVQLAFISVYFLRQFLYRVFGFFLFLLPFLSFIPAGFIV